MAGDGAAVGELGAVAQKLDEADETQGPHARRDEFDRQGKTVDLPADLADEPGLGRIEGEVG